MTNTMTKTKREINTNTMTHIKRKHVEMLMTNFLLSAVADIESHCWAPTSAVINSTFLQIVPDSGKNWG